MTSRVRHSSIKTRAVAQRPATTPSIEEFREHHPRIESNIAQPQVQHLSTDSHNALNGSSAGIPKYLRHYLLIFYFILKKAKFYIYYFINNNYYYFLC